MPIFSNVYHIDPSIYGWLGQQGYWGGTPMGQPPPTSGAGTTGAMPGSTGVPTAPTPSPVSTPTGFQLNPTPHAGQGTYGLVPGALGLPDPAGDLAKQIPGLAGLNQRASGVINSYLGGELPPDVIAQIQDAAAQFGVGSGMPGSGLQRNRTARDLGLTSLDLTGRGLQAYNPFVASVSGTQTVSPALQTQIAETNALNAAAPDPTAAQSHAEALYRDYLNSLSRFNGGGSNRPQSYQSFSPSGGTSASPLATSARYGRAQNAIPPIGAPGTTPPPTSGFDLGGGGFGGNFQGFDSILNDSLGVPEIGFDTPEYFGPYAPSYGEPVDLLQPSEFDYFGGTGYPDMDYADFMDWFSSGG